MSFEQNVSMMDLVIVRQQRPNQMHLPKIYNDEAATQISLFRYSQISLFVHKFHLTLFSIELIVTFTTYFRLNK